MKPIDMEKIISRVFDDTTNNQYSVLSEIESIIHQVSNRGHKLTGVGISSLDYMHVVDNAAKFRKLRVVVSPKIATGHFWFELSDGSSFMYCTYLDRPRTFGYEPVECGDPECRIESIHKM